VQKGLEEAREDLTALGTEEIGRERLMRDLKSQQEDQNQNQVEEEQEVLSGKEGEETEIASLSYLSDSSQNAEMMKSLAESFKNSYRKDEKVRIISNLSTLGLLQIFKTALEREVILTEGAGEAILEEFEDILKLVKEDEEMEEKRREREEELKRLEESPVFSSFESENYPSDANLSLLPPKPSQGRKKESVFFDRMSKASMQELETILANDSSSFLMDGGVPPSFSSSLGHSELIQRVGIARARLGHSFSNRMEEMNDLLQIFLRARNKRIKFFLSNDPVQVRRMIFRSDFRGVLESGRLVFFFWKFDE